MDSVTSVAREAGCRRLWLTTTNDNERAIGFYRRWGMSLATVHRGAVARSRAVKPTIPLRIGGVALDDELEFELLL
jgi:ribosomal protein S18 acetylase RimI-like enzyme